MNYNKLSERAHNNAIVKGFWDKQLSESHSLALVFTEICEAIEADRKEKRADVGVFKANSDASDITVLDKEFYMQVCFDRFIKDTVEDEFADAVIRLLDLAGHLKIDFERLPSCKYYRVFNRFTFTENAFGLIKGLAKEAICIEKRVQFGLNYIQEWADHLEIDLAYHVEQKMKYNEGREAMHGKKY